MNRTRPPALDLAIVVVIVGLVAGLFVLQSRLRGSSAAQPGASSSGTAPAPRPSSRSTPGQVPSSPASPSVSRSPSVSTGPSATTPAGAGTAASPADGAGVIDPELAAEAQRVAGRRPATFRVGTFNVLGHSHTTAKGDSKMKTPGTVRMRHAVQVLAQHRMDVVGFQELEPIQSRTFQRLAGGQWEIYPAVRSEADMAESIAWRRDVWRPVARSWVPMPYFNGQMQNTPAVRLRHLASGREVWFVNVHYPADTWFAHRQERWRDDSIRRTVAGMRQLHADGTPVVLVGDMNERDDFFCTLSAAAPVSWANGGRADRGACVPPRPTPIDWIVATRDVRWDGYTADRGPLVRRATDHPVYSAAAHLQ